MAARDRAWQADERIRGSLASAARHAADSGGLGRRGRLPDPIRDSLGPGHHPGRRCSRRSGRAAARLTAGVARPAGRLPVAGHSFGGPVAPPPSGSGHAHRGRTRPGVHPGSHVSPGQPPAQGCPDDPARRRAHDTLHRSSRPGRAHPPRRRAMITRAGRAREGAPAQRRPVSGLRRCCQLSVGEAAGCCIYLIP